MQRSPHVARAGAIAALLTADTAGAAIVDVAEQVAVLDPAPASVELGALEDSEHMHVFDEQQCRQLRAPLHMDQGGIVPRHTWVSSHLIHMDMADPPGKDPTFGVVEFDAVVLGAITTDARLHESDLRNTEISLLGSVVYPPLGSTRGLESDDYVNLGQFDVEFTFSVTDPADGFDQVRIITYCTPPNAN